ncbi:MAG: aminopeptidase N, partial [Pseudomonadota bacterium]
MPAETTAHAPVRLADYRSPEHLIDTVELRFDLDPDRTIVQSRLAVRRAEGAPADAPLRLDGCGLELLALRLDGAPLGEAAYVKTDSSLTIVAPPAAFILEIETACAPAANTALEGLYVSNDMFCTQCEAEGFRRITYFPDRPDVMSAYSVRLEADKAR